MRKRFTEVEDWRIAHYDVGKGPAVLLLHGIPTSAYLWRNVIASMRKSCRCIAPDIPGLGDSVGPVDSDYSMPAQASRMIALLDALSLREAVVVAHDQGGGVAQILAARHPDRIRALVLANSVCYDNWPPPVIRALMMVARRRSLFHFVLHSPLRDFWTKSSRIGYRSGATHKSLLDDDTIEEFSRPFKGSGDAIERFRRFTLAGDSRHTLEALPGLRAFRKPTLLVWAEDDPHLGGVEWARKLQADIPGVRRIETIPECGHFLQEEKPKVVRKILLRFLEDEGIIPPRGRGRRARQPAGEGDSRVAAPDPVD